MESFELSAKAAMYTAKEDTTRAFFMCFELYLPSDYSLLEFWKTEFKKVLEKESANIRITKASHPQKLLHFLKIWTECYPEDFLRSRDTLDNMVDTLKTLRRDYPETKSIIKLLIGRWHSLRRSSEKSFVPRVVDQPKCPPHADFTKWAMKDLAKELTRIEWDLFSSLKPRDFVRSPLQGNLALLAERSNTISDWVASEIVSTATHKERARVLRLMVDLSSECLKLQNFNTAGSILLGLKHSCVERLTVTLSTLSVAHVKKMEELGALVSPKGNFKHYLRAIKPLEAPMMPYLPYLLKTFASVRDGNPAYLESGRVNFDRMIALYVAHQRLVKPCLDGPYKLASAKKKRIAEFSLALPRIHDSTAMLDFSIYNQREGMQPTQPRTHWVEMHPWLPDRCRGDGPALDRQSAMSHSATTFSTAHAAKTLPSSPTKSHPLASASSTMLGMAGTRNRRHNVADGLTSPRTRGGARASAHNKGKRSSADAHPTRATLEPRKAAHEDEPGHGGGGDEDAEMAGDSKRHTKHSQRHRRHHHHHRGKHHAGGKRSKKRVATTHTPDRGDVDDEAPMVPIDPRDKEAMDQKNISSYRLLSSIIVPRPIAWVSTVSSKGIHNLAPYSFFNGVSSNPPTIMISIGKRHSDTSSPIKDTLQNIMDTKEFVINMVSEKHLNAMNATCGDYPPAVDEFDVAGLQVAPSVVVKPGRVKGAHVAMECTLLSTIPVEGSTYTMVLGRVVHYHVRASVLRENYTVDAEKLDAVARLGKTSDGMDEYALQGELVHCTRPSASSPEKPSASNATTTTSGDEEDESSLGEEDMSWKPVSSREEDVTSSEEGSDDDVENSGMVGHHRQVGEHGNADSSDDDGDDDGVRAPQHGKHVEDDDEEDHKEEGDMSWRPTHSRRTKRPMWMSSADPIGSRGGHFGRDDGMHDEEEKDETHEDGREDGGGAFLVSNGDVQKRHRGSTDYSPLPPPRKHDEA